MSEFSFGVFALGVVATLATSIVVRRYHVRLDNDHARVDEFCEAVRSSVEMGMDYWTSDYDDDKIFLYTARIKSVDQKIAALYGTLSSIDQDYGFELEGRILDLLDALTGGDFEVSGRKSSLQNAVQVSNRAAVLEAAVRRIQRTKMSPLYFI